MPACPLWSNSQQRRNLNVHEHVSYSLLKGAGIPVPKFGVAKTGKEAAELVQSLGLTDIAVKAQVLGVFGGGWVIIPIINNQYYYNNRKVIYLLKCK